MREKICRVLRIIYGIAMSVSFFGGVLPVIPFLVALMIGGETGESIAVFLKTQYYPWVIVIGSVAIIVGLISMYIGKVQGLSIKNVSADKKTDSDNKQ